MKRFAFFSILIILILLSKLIINNSFRSKQENIEYRGVLVEIFNNTNDREVETYRIKTAIGNINETAEIYKGSSTYIEIGDSIIKEKGKLQITIKKKESNFSVSATFPYE